MSADQPRPVWAFLFGSRASFEGDGELPGTDGDRRVRVIRDASRDDLARAREVFGMALFGSRGLAEPDFARAGFTYVRRFAVFPSAQRARWVVPLANPTLATGALRALATPYRHTGRVLARLALLTLRVPRAPWTRSRELWIASRESPRLEIELESAIGSRPAAIGLASGSWGMRHTPTVVALAANGRPMAFAKLATEDESRRLVAHEAAVLEALARRPDLDGLAPRLLYAGAIDGTFANVQTPVEGDPGPERLSAAHERFLAALRDATGRDAAETELVRELVARAAGAPSQRGMLASAVRKARAVLAGLEVRSTIVHGDFSPFNVRVRSGRLAAFDWENATLDGLPLLDEIHHELHAGLLIRDWDVAAALRALDRFAVRRARAELSRARVRALEVMYLADVYLRRLRGGYTERDRVTSTYLELLRLLASESAA